MITSGGWSLASLTPPWSGASLYVHIRDNPNLFELPDEKREPNKVHFAAGAWDGILSHHMASDAAKQAERAGKIEQALERLLLASNDQNLKELYEAVTSDSFCPVADELAQRFVERILIYSEEMAATARYFLVGADHREATKFGIILLGVAGDSSDVKLLETVAGHDEFSLFAAVALTLLVDDPEQLIWRLAQRVHGWGRVQLVERLDGTSNPEIQDWMLREGFRNSIMDNYLAEICARTGRLHEVLQQPAVDAQLLDSAADLLAALIEGGPSAGIDDYENAQEALQGYLSHLSQSHDPRLAHFLTVDQILQFLNDEPSWEKRLAQGWSVEVRQRLRTICEKILRRETWQSKVHQGLHSEDRLKFHIADMAASRLGRNTWEIHFKKLHQTPFGDHWFRLMQLTDESNIDQVLAFAAKVIPLQKIATGPADSLGFGQEFEAHTALDWILQGLSRFPERGWPFITAGLQSPVVRNRNAALTALLAWPRERWPEDAFSLLHQASSTEPDKTLKGRLAQAIQVQ